MHKNSTMLAASFVALALVSGGASIQAAEEGGGAEATEADMPKICDDQAKNRQLTGAERSTYLKQCTESTPQSVQRSARKMEGTK